MNVMKVALFIVSQNATIYHEMPGGVVNGYFLLSSNVQVILKNEKIGKRRRRRSKEMNKKTFHDMKTEFKN